MRPYSWVASFLISTLVALSVWGQTDSPFEPPGSGAPKKAPTIATPTRKPVPTTAISSEIEMRGFFKLGEVYYFSILNKKTKKSEWVSLGEETADQFLALRFDPEKELLTMDRHGTTEKISLHESQWGKKPSGGKI